MLHKEKKLVDDKIIIKNYAKNMHKVRGELYRFLINLDEEKETFLKYPLPDENYQKSMVELVANTFFASTAWKDDGIIGVEALNWGKTGILKKFWPICRGYTCVSKPYQGKGIGTLLNREKSRFLESVCLFHETITRNNNVKMIKITLHIHYEMVFRDEKFVYHVKSSNRYLRLFNPAFIWFYSIFKRSRHSRLKNARIAQAV